MTGNEFIAFCTNKIKAMYDFELKDEPKQVFVVWYSKTLQNQKALLGTNVDDNYYECTYGGDTNDIYIAVYQLNEEHVYNLK